MVSPSDETEQFAPTPEPAPDTAQFPVTRVQSDPAGTPPQHAVSSDAPGISRGGWWAITIAAGALLVLGVVLALFGPVRYWTPVPVVFLTYFFVSGAIGLVFWKGVRELRDSTPNLDTHETASTGARVAAAIGAVGVASALVLLPAGLSSAPANALPCPDGSNTCGPTAPTFDPGPTQGGGQTAPQAPQTTVPGYTPPNTPAAPTQGTPNDGGNFHVQTPDFGTPEPGSCIVGCDPTAAQPPRIPGNEATAPTAGQQPQNPAQQNPVTTAPNTPATTPRVPTTTPKLRTPSPETTTSATRNRTVSDRDNDDRDENKDEDRRGWPYAVAELAAVAGTYRRRTATATRLVRDGQVVADDTMVLMSKVEGNLQWSAASDGRRKAIEYTERYAEKANPAFQNYGGSADCTNFVSQAMREGGFEDVGNGIDDWHRGDSDDWYYQTNKAFFGNRASNTWALAKANHDFITQKSGRGEIASVYKTPANSPLDPLAPSKAGLRPGDLIYYKNSEGTINHVAMYVGQVNSPSGPIDVVNQHSTDFPLHDDWMPEAGGNYRGGVAQAEFVKLKYPGE